MKRLNALLLFTRTCLFIGLLLLAYGYLSQSLPIYFFWESKYIGQYLLLFGAIGFAFRMIHLRKREGKNTLWAKIGVGILSFYLLVKLLIILIIPYSTAYEMAKRHIATDENIRSVVGDIQGHSLIPEGGISKQSDSNGTKGDASLALIIKGEKAFKIVYFYAAKPYESEWELTKVVY